MKPTGKTLSAILLTTMLFCTACHRKNDERQVTGTDGRFPGTEVQLLDNSAPPDLSLTDTSLYYYGEVDGIRCFVKVDNAGTGHLQGRYFPINSTDWTGPVQFELRNEDGDWRFHTADRDLNLKFNVRFQPFHIVGSYQTSWLRHEQKEIELERYDPPFHTTYQSTLNILLSDPQTFDCKLQKDIVYGKARGYWTSNPEHEEKYVKIIAKSILKTFMEKELDLTLDLYSPEDSLSKHPLIVFIHGGAFYIGDKGAETMTAWCRHFAQLGYVTASINYRMGFKPNKTSIQQCGYCAVQDAHAALRHLTAHAEELGIDTSFIFLAGTSAGAITALATALWTPQNQPGFIADNNFESSLGPLQNSGNNETACFRIRAIANMWGAVYDLDELDKNTVPIISFHGTADNIVPFDKGVPFSSLGEKLFDPMYGSHAIHEQLNRLQVRNEMYPLEKLGHGPYQDKKGHPNECYFFIQQRMQEFFQKEISHVGPIRYVSPQIYTLDQNDVRIVHWKAEGGFIIRCEGTDVQVVWRKDCPKHMLTASGLRENGAAFTKTVHVKLLNKTI